MVRVAIVGNGWVGKAMQDLFPDALVYVRNKNKFPDKKGLVFTDSKNLINGCDIAFVCVPTPLGGDGRLDTSIVEECVAWLKTPLIVIRSTVNPGDCDKWVKRYSTIKFRKEIVFMPEYLGETPSHPLLNENNTKFIILGGSAENRRKTIELFQTVYNANITIRQVSLLEAEVIKLSENRAISWKVSQCQELYDVCEKAGVDYYTVRDAVYGDDPRFNLWFTFVYPKSRGFHSSKCLKKDVPAFVTWAEGLGANADMTRLLVKKSEEAYAG